MTRLIFLLILPCVTGLPRSQSTTSFYTKFSEGCMQSNIFKDSDCPGTSNKTRWIETNTKKPSGFKSFAQGSLKCHFQLLVQRRKCKAVPSCLMTTYQYVLPKPPKKSEIAQCSNAFSIETECNSNSNIPNKTTVYSACFSKGARPPRTYCSIDFQTCKAFQWTKFRLQCYATCKTSKFEGLAKKMVRKCINSSGQSVDEENCRGGIAGATVLRKCFARSNAPSCNPPDALVTTEKFPTMSNSTDSTQPELYTTILQETTAFSETSTTITAAATDKTEGAESSIYSDKTEATMSYVTATSSKEINSAANNNTNVLIPSRKILLPFLKTLTTSPHVNGTVPPEVFDEEKNAKTFDLVAIAGGAGAGLLFVFLMSLIIVLLVRRKDHKLTSGNSIISSTSSYRARSARNPVVDSSSFRIATWIRERPSLPNGGSISPSESVVSDAEYWKEGQSVDDLTARYDKDRRGSKTSEVPDVVRNVSREENIYDEVYSSDGEEMPTTSNGDAAAPFNSRPPSLNQSYHDRIDVNIPLDKNSVYAAVQKSRRREQRRRRSSTTSTGAARRRIASQHSVTNLNGKHLRDGVLQIEFNEQKGVRCKLSESDTYIDLGEADELPSAI